MLLRCSAFFLFATVASGCGGLVSDDPPAQAGGTGGHPPGSVVSAGGSSGAVGAAGGSPGVAGNVTGNGTGVGPGSGAPTAACGAYEPKDFFACCGEPDLVPGVHEFSGVLASQHMGALSSCGPYGVAVSIDEGAGHLVQLGYGFATGDVTATPGTPSLFGLDGTPVTATFEDSWSGTSGRQRMSLSDDAGVLVAVDSAFGDTVPSMQALGDSITVSIGFPVCGASCSSRRGLVFSGTTVIALGVGETGTFEASGHTYEAVSLGASDPPSSGCSSGYADWAWALWRKSH